ncbi:MAG: hypothetical protein KIS76_00135 [Pyrinomonadaceae bacterium]|nr:hypothetical protein [Pyrinomonadaceae bacterium]
MTENLPGYISILFILTTFATVGFLFYAVRQIGTKTTAAAILVGAVSFWFFFTGAAALSGFYAVTDTLPPRLFLFGALPSLLLIAIYFVFFRTDFVEKLPLSTLTLLSIVRIPVEIVIYLLFQNGLMPEAMTFQGWNYDILSGISAPVIFLIAFRGGKMNRPVLIVWNLAALALLIIIVTTAILALASPLQQIAFDQPNRAVLAFPFVWLPAIVVPIVVFSHLVSLWQIYKNKKPAN